MRKTLTITITSNTIILLIVTTLLIMNILINKTNKNIITQLNTINKTLETIEEDNNESQIIDGETHKLPCKKLGLFKLTFYTPTELGKTHANQLKTATGTIPQEGRTIAVDSRIIKKGSLVYIEGWGYYIAEDTGSAIKGKKIDIFLNSYQMAKSLGNKRKANVYLIR